ncbi:MAG: TrkA family potassium uptake protein [Deltaproteobacteria bacterium]|nr:TrkA family potassium uptake protein [Deltaproteobacteria bacterium]
MNPLNFNFTKRSPSATKDFAVIGLGRFGSAVCEALYKAGHEVLAIDEDERRINQALADHIASHAIVLDITEPAALKEAGLEQFNTVVVALGNFVEQSVIAVLALKDAGVNNVIAKASSEMHVRLLSKVGADQVVFPEREMGIELARVLAKPSIVDWLDLDAENSIAEIKVPESFIDKTLFEIQLRARYNVNLIGIRYDNRLDVALAPNMIFKEGMVLIIIGCSKAIENLA